MSNNVSGEDLLKMGEEMFGTTDLTKEQLAYLIDMLRPSSYLLRNHSVKNRPFTFSISNRNSEKARSHRPWQVDK